MKMKKAEKVSTCKISQRLGWERNKMRMIPWKLRRKQKEQNREGLVSTELEHIVKPFVVQILTKTNIL